MFEISMTEIGRQPPISPFDKGDLNISDICGMIWDDSVLFFLSLQKEPKKNRLDKIRGKGSTHLDEQPREGLNIQIRS